MGKALAALLVLLTLSGCVHRIKRPPASPPFSADTLTLYDRYTPYDFLDQLPPPPSVWTIKRHYARLLAYRYAPWLQPIRWSSEQMAWPYRYYAKKRLFGINRRPLSPKILKTWRQNADLTKAGTINRLAISVKSTDLRLFPSDRPIFYNPALAGEGYPFDYNQNSALPPLTPLRVSHFSRDGAWAYVRTPFAEGWVTTDRIAFISRRQAQKLAAAPLGVSVAPRRAVRDGNGRFLFYAKSATLFFLSPDGRKLLLPYRDAEAKVRFITTPKPAWIRRTPLLMERQNVQSMLSTLWGEPYGWGGLAGFRDCSAMTRDFFLPFGLRLPRNSSAQAQTGTVINLKGLSPDQKERRIIQLGVPFRTLLHLPGHIMLYIGHKNGRAYVLHNTWGIKTRRNGRILIGRAVVSDLWPGRHLKRVDPKSLWIARIDSMQILLPLGF